jgi:hypothetical protein
MSQNAFCPLYTGFWLGVFLKAEDGDECSSEMSVGFQRSRQRYVPEFFVRQLQEPEILQNDTCLASQQIYYLSLNPKAVTRVSR